MRRHLSVTVEVTVETDGRSVGAVRSDLLHLTMTVVEGHPTVEQVVAGHTTLHREDYKVSRWANRPAHPPTLQSIEGQEPQ